MGVTPNISTNSTGLVLTSTGNAYAFGFAATVLFVANDSSSPITFYPSTNAPSTAGLNGIRLSTGQVFGPVSNLPPFTGIGFQASSDGPAIRYTAMG